MKIRIAIIVCALLAAMQTVAQKKEISQARTLIKSGKSLDKAEQLMTDLLKDSANRNDRRVRETLFDAVELQYEAANEKLYLRQQYDTAQFFGLVRRLFLVAEGLDSADVKHRLRKRHAEQLNLLRRNLYNGGLYQVKKACYEEAFGFFETYIETIHQPLFSGYNYLRDDSLVAQAAYWATYCGHQLQHPDSVLRYRTTALHDLSKREYVLQYVCEAYRQQQNDTAYVASLRQGFDTFPEHPYFFPRLADWYMARRRYTEALQLADHALDINSRNPLFLLAKSAVQLNTGDDEGCEATSLQLIELNDSIPEPYFNIASVRLNKALALEQQNDPRRHRQKLHQLYTEALPYMEDYRRLAPDDVMRWGPALYRIYLNMNMGRQFEEIDKLLQQY